MRRLDLCVSQIDCIDDIQCDTGVVPGREVTRLITRQHHRKIIIIIVIIVMIVINVIKCMFIYFEP